MTKAGHGQILGVTSGSGWRPADVGAYGCAKRAVAALTWQIGQVTPAGRDRQCTLSHRRDPDGHRRAARGRRRRRVRPVDADTGGLTLGSMPPPENLGPVGAYLASEEFSWCRGQIIFSGGAELAWLGPPRLLEVSRSREVDLPAAPAGRGHSGRLRAGRGGAGEQRWRQPSLWPRVRRAGRAAPADRAAHVRSSHRRRRLGRGDGRCTRRARGQVRRRCLAGARTGPARAGTGFGAAGATGRLARDSGPLDAVVVALVGGGGVKAGTWQAGPRRARGDCGERPHRCRVGPCGVGLFGGDRTADPGRDRHRRRDRRWPKQGPVGGATGSGAAHGALRPYRRLRDQCRAAPRSPSARPSLTSSPTSWAAASRRPVGRGAGRRRGWFGLRSHPNPAATISFGGPAIPEWLDGTLRHRHRKLHLSSTHRSASAATKEELMSTEIERIVDAHVHLWDPARADWYPYLTGLHRARHGRHLGVGPLLRPDDLLLRIGEVERAEVRARRGATDFVAETMEKDERHRGRVTPTPSSAGSTPESACGRGDRPARPANGLEPLPRDSADGRRPGGCRPDSRHTSGAPGA